MVLLSSPPAYKYTLVSAVFAFFGSIFNSGTTHNDGEKIINFPYTSGFLNPLKMLTNPPIELPPIPVNSRSFLVLK